jgi:hypothetical protein
MGKLSDCVVCEVLREPCEDHQPRRVAASDTDRPLAVDVLMRESVRAWDRGFEVREEV